MKIRLSVDDVYIAWQRRYCIVKHFERTGLPLVKLFLTHILRMDSPIDQVLGVNFFFISVFDEISLS